MKLRLLVSVLALLANTAMAQPPPRVRGVIQSLEGQTLVVATQNEGVVRLNAWDLPDSTMTNGAATGIVARGRSGTVNVRHAGGTVEIAVTRKTQIVALTQGSRALLVPGATVMALAVPTDGGATAVAIIAETNGVKPPM